MPKNLFNFERFPETSEDFTTLFQDSRVQIERIVSSNGYASEEVRQGKDEWVVLLAGNVEFNCDDKEISLAKGDYLFIPAGTKHTVLKTSNGAIWLAVHFLT